MSPTDSTFHRALMTLLIEIFDGPPGKEAFVLNPGDPGLLRQLDTIDSKTASTRSVPGRTTIAAHVNHVLYGIGLLNRWAAGEENPWADADWDASWKAKAVTTEQWRELREKLGSEAAAWKRHVEQRTDWDHMAASGALASAAHTAYHLGAIRQILAAEGQK